MYAYTYGKLVLRNEMKKKQDGGVQSMRIPMDAEAKNYRNVYRLFTFGRFLKKLRIGFRRETNVTDPSRKNKKLTCFTLRHG